MLSSNLNLQVLAISPGIAVGRVQPVRRKSSSGVPVLQEIAPDMVENELARLEQSIRTTRNQLQALKERVLEKLKTDDVGILDAHLLLVDDLALRREVEQRIREKHWTAEYSLYDTAEHFARVFANMQDEYLKERAVDIRDVSDRLLRNLSAPEEVKDDRDDHRIIVANTLTPSETAGLDSNKILGFAIETGSATCHTAILARSMRLPAVAGVPAEIINTLSAEDKLIIDGFSGRLIINPDARTEESYRLRARSAVAFYNQLEQDKKLRPETTDGFEIELAINVGSVEQISELKTAGASGVGLLRTEFLFFGENSVPDEESQFEVYRKLLTLAGDAPVTVRTMDIGGDKLDNNIFRSSEANPFLGLRGIRLCLYERMDLFKTQLRALLRAGVFGNLRIMFPMVSSVLEVLEVKKVIASVQQELADEKREFLRKPVIGVMIETPAAALMADELGKLVDFFSIGTNDLVQYTMAIDRGNERVAYLYKPAHPAILKLISLCVAAAHKNNIYVGVCGQMASEPELVPLLVGLGVHELSMDPGAVPLIRRVIRGLSLFEAQRTAAEAMMCPNAAESLRVSLALLERLAPDLFEALQKNENITSKEKI